MPPRNKDTVSQIERQVHNYARLFETFNVSFISNGDPINLRAEECPFCSGEKFYVNVGTGQYQCKAGSCQATGNIYTFLTWLHQHFLRQTTPEHYSLLGRKRGGIPPQTLRRHELAFDAEEDRWLIPFKSMKGNIVNFQLYYWNRDKPNKMNLSGLPTSIYNLHNISADKNKHLFTCEGPFDAIALDYALGPKYRSRYDIVATPGGLSKACVEHYRERKVRALFDNDKGGEKHRLTMQKLLGESRIADELLMLKWPQDTPEGYDINDLVREHPNDILAFINERSYKFVPQPRLLINHGRRKGEDARPIDWIWPHHLRCGTYASFAGQQGTFKTSIGVYVAARYSQGEPLPTVKDEKLAWEDVEMPAGHLLYIHAEDDRDRIENDFEQAGGDFGHWHCMAAKTQDDDQLNILEHLVEMEQTIREFGIRLVIIDGQNSVVGAPCIATDMLARANVTNKLHSFAQRLNICLLGIRNEDKEGRALGPQSMGDIGRCVLRAVEDEPKSDPPFCQLIFVKVSDTARSNYQPIPYSVQDLGGSSRRILWGKIRPEQEAVNNIAERSRQNHPIKPSQ